MINGKDLKDLKNRVKNIFNALSDDPVQLINAN